MNTPSILQEPAAVRQRLASLGWTESELAEIVHAMVAARHGCTANDPTSAPGWVAWKDGTRRTRELGVLKGWRRLDIDQVPWTVDVAGGNKFTVVNANDATGLAGRAPQNRSKKGAGTERAVFANAGQLTIDFPDRSFDGESDVLAERTVGATSWYLFVYVEGDTVRAELSCPIDMSNGYFCEFKERIFLAPEWFTRLGEGVVTDDAIEEFDIPIERLASP